MFGRSALKTAAGEIASSCCPPGGHLPAPRNLQGRQVGRRSLCLAPKGLPLGGTLEKLRFPSIARQRLLLPKNSLLCHATTPPRCGHARSLPVPLFFQNHPQLRRSVRHYVQLLGSLLPQVYNGRPGRGRRLTFVLQKPHPEHGLGANCVLKPQARSTPLFVGQRRESARAASSARHARALQPEHLVLSLAIG